MNKFIQAVFAYLFLTNILIFGHNKINLKNINYNQGQLADNIIFQFDATPICIYEPGKNIELFLPLAQTNPSIIKQMQNNASLISAKIEINQVVKPVVGLKIKINHDKNKYICDYNIEKNILKISFNNTKKINLLKENISTLC